MNVKVSGCSALILATGLFVCFSGPSQAAGDTDGTTATSAKQTTRNLKAAMHRKAARVAGKPAADKNAAVSDDSTAAMPPWVANANAQLTSADTPTVNAQAMTVRANDMLQTAPADPQFAADSQVVSPDQLNDVDRALHEGQPPPIALASADDPPPVVSAAPPMASRDSSTWEQTSLIGKIFIAFGGLLTVASAARMFMA
jgi:hypothetical protein